MRVLFGFSSALLPWKLVFPTEVFIDLMPLLDHGPESICRSL
jgi:hypothetical protein